MKRAPFKLFGSVCVISILLPTLFSNAVAQQKAKEPRLQCSPQAFRAMKPLPELSYPCNEEDEEKQLKSKERRQALRQHRKRLEQFTSAAWWNAPVEELNVCEAFKRPHVLTQKERDEYLDSNFLTHMSGDSKTRLVATSDPCVAPNYNSTDAFILQRAGDKVVATQILNGYYSRADNSVGLSIADTDSERLLEIYTGTGGLNPYCTTRLFAIDKASNRAVPKKIIKDGNKLTNEITSNCAMEIWASKLSFNLPKGWLEMSIINKGKRAERFYVYDEDMDKLIRRTYVWNGSYYAVQKRRARKPHR